MSQQACEEFYAKINTDVALQQEVGAAVEGKEDIAAATAFAEVGAKHGYEFTAEDAAQKHLEILADAEGELHEEALDNVAGGGWVSEHLLCFLVSSFSLGKAKK